MKKLIFEQRNVDTYVEKTGQSAIDKFLGIRDMPETPTQTGHITTLEYDQLSHKIAVWSTTAKTHLTNQPDREAFGLVRKGVGQSTVLRAVETPYPKVNPIQSNPIIKPSCDSVKTKLKHGKSNCITDRRSQQQGSSWFEKETQLQPMQLLNH